ncbi:MAG: 50S ribosomal protein L3 N(5)-glutamine methyltransferase [Gammaproteobacteria bacterium]
MKSPAEAKQAEAKQAGDKRAVELERAVRIAVKSLRTVADMVRFGTSRMEQAGLCHGHGTDNAIDEAMSLTLHALHLSAPLPAEFWSARLTRDERREVCELFTRRIVDRVPAAYLTGHAVFAGLEFKVTPHVLVPRSPIAELIEQRFTPWLDEAKVKRIADVGTGSGCIAIACAMHFPDAKIDAVDISGEALAVAADNVAVHGVAGQVQLVQADLVEGLNGRYDLIVSNPPYVDAPAMATLPAEFEHEPALGLAAGEDGLDSARRIIDRAASFLREDGLLVVEVGTSRPALERTYPDLPFTWVEFERGGEGVFVLEAAALI